MTERVVALFNDLVVFARDRTKPQQQQQQQPAVIFVVNRTPPDVLKRQSCWAARDVSQTAGPQGGRGEQCDSAAISDTYPPRSQQITLRYPASARHSSPLVYQLRLWAHKWNRTLSRWKNFTSCGDIAMQELRQCHKITHLHGQYN